MIKLTTFSLFALLITSGCSYHTYDGSGRSLVSVRVHDATPEQEQAIARGAHLWDVVGARIRWEGEEAGGEILNVYVKYGFEVPLSVDDGFPRYANVLINCGSGTNNAIGCYNPNTGNISLSGTYGKINLIAAHEIGHSIGLHHLPEQTAIMYPDINATVVSEDDIIQYDLRWSRYSDSGHPDDKPVVEAEEVE